MWSLIYAIKDVVNYVDGDDRPRQMISLSYVQSQAWITCKTFQNRISVNLSKKAKALVSPYFAPAYALA